MLILSGIFTAILFLYTLAEKDKDNKKTYSIMFIVAFFVAFLTSTL